MPPGCENKIEKVGGREGRMESAKLLPVALRDIKKTRNLIFKLICFRIKGEKISKNKKKCFHSKCS